MIRDYAPDPELDRYDPALVDDESRPVQMGQSDRRRVERLLDARDRQTSSSVTRPRTAYQGLRDLMETGIE